MIGRQIDPEIGLCLVRTRIMNFKHFEFIFVPYEISVMRNYRLMLQKLNRRLPFSSRDTYRGLIKRLLGDERLVIMLFGLPQGQSVAWMIVPA